MEYVLASLYEAYDASAPWVSNELALKPDRTKTPQYLPCQTVMVRRDIAAAHDRNNNLEVWHCSKSGFACAVVQLLNMRPENRVLFSSSVRVDKYRDKFLTTFGFSSGCSSFSFQKRGPERRALTHRYLVSDMRTWVELRMVMDESDLKGVWWHRDFDWEKVSTTVVTWN